MRDKVRWGVLSTAHFALTKAIPAMQKGEWSDIVAIASRDTSKAEKAAKELGIPQAYGSYEELLASPEIEAVYNPLPNHMHVPWSIKAAEAGKHVLCEKPLSMSVAEAQQLIAARDRARVKIGEAFMVRTHPQWLRTRELIGSGRRERPSRMVLEEARGYRHGRSRAEFHRIGKTRHPLRSSGRARQARRATSLSATVG